MRPIGISLGLTLFVLLPLNAPAQVSITMQVGKPDTPIVGLPFSADQSVRVVRHLANGTVLTSEIRGHVYRSAEGLERYEGTLVSTDPAKPEPATQVLLLDRVKRTYITFNSKGKTATLQHIPAEASVLIMFLPLQQPTYQNRAVKPQDLTTTDLGKKTLGLHTIIGKRVSGSIPAGAMGNDQPIPITAEVWSAPDLELIVSQSEKNPLTGERTYELTNIRAEEPDPALFQVPDGYTVKEQSPPPGSALAAALATPEALEPRTKEMEEALHSPDPSIRNRAIAAEDTRNADIASGYAAELAGTGDAGTTRLATSHAAIAVETAAAAAETAAAAVESDASQAATASAAGDRASVNRARDNAASHYSALLAADDQLAKAAADLVAAAINNANFYATSPGAAAINDMGAQHSSAAASLLSAVTKADPSLYRAAAANQATVIKDANSIAGLDPTRAPAFQAVAEAETEAQSAAMAAAAPDSPSAAAAEAAAATAGATADGPGNPYAGAVESGAAAIANAASATISAQHAMDKLKTLQ